MKVLWFTLIVWLNVRQVAPSTNISFSSRNTSYFVRNSRFNFGRNSGFVTSLKENFMKEQVFSFQLSYETLFCGIHCVHYTKFHKKVNKQILWTSNFRNLIFPVTSNEVPYVNRGPFVAAMKGTWFLLKNTTDNSLTYIFGGFKESATTWLSQLDPNVKVVLSL